VEDGIPGGLQYHHKTCCKKDGLVCLEVTPLQGCSFQMSGLVYDSVVDLKVTGIQEGTS